MRDAVDYQPYARDIFDRLGLKDWEVVVLGEPPDNPDAFAHVVCVYGRKMARVKFSRNFLRGTETEQRHAMVHEALHAHFTAADQVAHDLAGGDHFDAYKLLMEYGVDGIAVAIAPLMPLPSAVLGG